MELEGITRILMDRIARGESGANLDGRDGKNLAPFRRALTCCFFLLTPTGGPRWTRRSIPSDLLFYSAGLVFVCLQLRGGRAFGGISNLLCVGKKKSAIN